MQKINYQSDFELICHWVGEDDIIPFVLEYKSGNSVYTASFNGTTWRNCHKVDDKTIKVFFDNHNLRPGALMCKMTYWLKNDHYLDQRQTIVQHINTDVQLVVGSGDEVINDLTMEIAPNYMKGESGASAYEIAVEHGFVGTEEEWLESLKANVSLVVDEENGACIVIDGRKFKLGEEVLESAE